MLKNQTYHISSQAKKRVYALVVFVFVVLIPVGSYAVYSVGAVSGSSSEDLFALYATLGLGGLAAGIGAFFGIRGKFKSSLELKSTSLEYRNPAGKVISVYNRDISKLILTRHKEKPIRLQVHSSNNPVVEIVGFNEMEKIASSLTRKLKSEFVQEKNISFDLTNPLYTFALATAVFALYFGARYAGLELKYANYTTLALCGIYVIFKKR